MSEPDTISPVVRAEWAQEHLDDAAVRFVEVDFGSTTYDQDTCRARPCGDGTSSSATPFGAT